MASLPISEAYFAPPSPSPSPVPKLSLVSSAVPQARLSALEWSIVVLAEGDGMASIREPGRLLSAFNSLFGFSPPYRLANERLETLRRVAIYAWNLGWNVPKSEIAGFLEAGFTNDHFELIQQSISKARLGRRRTTVK